MHTWACMHMDTHLSMHTQTSKARQEAKEREGTQSSLAACWVAISLELKHPSLEEESPEELHKAQEASESYMINMAAPQIYKSLGKCWEETGWLKGQGDPRMQSELSPMLG